MRENAQYVHLNDELPKLRMNPVQDPGVKKFRALKIKIELDLHFKTIFEVKISWYSPFNCGRTARAGWRRWAVPGPPLTPSREDQLSLSLINVKGTVWQDFPLLFCSLSSSRHLAIF